jgi:hypothetical protein
VGRHAGHDLPGAGRRLTHRSGMTCGAVEPDERDDAVNVRRADGTCLRRIALEDESKPLVPLPRPVREFIGEENWQDPPDRMQGDPPWPRCPPTRS